MLLDSDVDPEKLQGIGSELKNLIKSIEWDLEDLDQTISILSDLVLPHLMLLLSSPLSPLSFPPSPFPLFPMKCFVDCWLCTIRQDLPNRIRCCDSVHTDMI